MHDGGTIEVWGDGTAIRSYTYVDDMVDGIWRLMHYHLEGPTNIGSPEYVSVRRLVETAADVANKRVETWYVEGLVGVRSRNFSNSKIYSIGWQPRFSLREGLERTYSWIEKQVKAAAQLTGSDRIANESHPGE